MSYDTDELEKVDLLRSRLKNVMPSEMYEDIHYIIRFVRARNKDINAAEAMLRKIANIEWKKENNIDTISSWFKPHEVYVKYHSLNHMGFCKDGSAAIYSDLANLDARGLLSSETTTHGVNYVIDFLEKEVQILKKQSEKLNKNINQWIVVLNFDNYALSNATHKQTLEAFSKVIFLYERNYPEYLKNIFIINSSWYFYVLYNFLKPLIMGNTFRKIHVYGKDGWKEELLNHIDVDELPSFLGGNKTDPDGNPRCNSFISHGGHVPESYYAVNNKDDFPSLPDVKKLLIPRLSKTEIELHIAYPESIIEWEFKIKNRDIAVNLLCKDNKYSNVETKEVLLKNKYNISIGTESGLYKCEKAGMYYLEFDNTYSWIYQKEVYFRVAIVPPKECDRQNCGA